MDSNNRTDTTKCCFGFGKYNGTITHPDYDPLKVEFEITTGVTSFKHWLLVKKV